MQFAKAIRPKAITTPTIGNNKATFATDNNWT